MNVTDGPWVANIDHSGTGWRIETDAPGYPNDGWIIAELHGPDAAANAQAIALLPELIEALEAVLAAHAFKGAIGKLRQDVIDKTDSRARSILARLNGE